MLSELIHTSLRHRVLVVLIAAALCVFGSMAARELPIDVLPDITRPTVTVLSECPGLGPEEVEAQVCVPLEAALAGIPGAERMRSISGVGLCVIHVEFEWNADVFRVRQLVQERINDARDRLPAGTLARLGPVASIMGEVMLVGVSSPDGSLAPMQQRDAAEWLVRPALLSIPGVSQVTVHGGDVRQFQVIADPERLCLFGLTVADLERALAAASATAGGGTLSGASTAMVVRTVGRPRSTDDIGGALVAMRSGPDGQQVPVRIRDVAHVVDGPAPAATKRGEASIAGKPAVILAVSKAPGGDTRAITGAIDERLSQLGASLPKGLEIDAGIFRQSRFIDASIANLKEALLLGSVLVVLVLAAFLLNLWATLISLVALPVSILTTFIILKLLGQSINTMTLGGIAIATGELVDDAVVGVENMVRRLRVGYPDSPASEPATSTILRATGEVRGPIFISTLLILLVFVPLLFLPDLAGRLFTPLARAYIIAIAVSMVVSLTLTPALAGLLLKPRRAGSHAGGDSPALRAAKGLALRAYDISMPRPRAVVVACAIVFLLALVAVPFLGREFLPPFNEGTAVVSVTAAPGISLVESSRLGAAAEELLLTVPGVAHVARRTGRAEGDEHALGVNASEIEVGFAAGAVPRKLFGDIRARLADLPGVSVSVGQPIGHRIEHLESGVEAQIVVKVFGPELGELRRLGDRARSLVAAVPGATDVAVERQVLVPQVRFRVDAERAAGFGFTSSELVEAIQTIVGGKVVSQIVDGQRRIDLVLVLGDASSLDPRAAIASAAGMRLVSPSGAVALVSDVAEVREELGPSEVAREGGERRILVSCNVAPGHGLGETADLIQRTISDSLHAPTGYSVRVEGQQEGRRRAVRTITLLGIGVLVLMLALLWTHFRSLALALQVLLNIPFAFIGAVGALLIAGEPFSIASLIGFISLCGIAARNGVLMVSHYRTSGAQDRDAIVRASQERVAPVLMTALTTGLALVPILLARDAPGKEILYPLALTVCGGLITSTLLDFFVTPAIYLAIAGRRAVRL